MKVLIIYSRESKEQVEDLRQEIAEEFGKTTILRMNSRTRKKNSLFRHLWHRDARKMIRLADVIVYAVSNISADNKNVEWEIRQSLRYGKYIVCYPLTENATINKSLYSVDKNTKESICLADTIHSRDELFKLIRDYNSDSYIKLFNEDAPPQILLEQYKIFSNSAESLLDRRQSMNSFYISANTALTTIGATVFAMSDDEKIVSKLAIVIALSLPGIMANISWRQTLQSYYINNRGKMKILSMLEKRLSASLYDAEWKAMKNKYSKEKYVSFTDSEKKLPQIFILFYIGIDIAAIIMLFLYLFIKTA